MNVIYENKMGIYRRLKALVFAGLLGVVALGSSNSYADGVNMYGTNFAGISGLVPPSLPAFGTYINAAFTKGSSSSTLKVTQKSSYSVLMDVNSPYAYLISGTSYTLKATFNSSGVFTGGNVVIKGKISSLGINTTATLMTADLTSFAKSSNGYFWGFNTNNIVCHSAVHAAVYCTPAEVVYLGLASAQKSMTKSWKTSGVALTSVPVPAAAWLLGSGLLGLVAVGRRKSK